jgi:hypothetical protein
VFWAHGPSWGSERSHPYRGYNHTAEGNRTNHQQQNLLPIDLRVISPVPLRVHDEKAIGTPAPPPSHYLSHRQVSVAYESGGRSPITERATSRVQMPRGRPRDCRRRGEGVNVIALGRRRGAVHGSSSPPVSLSGVALWRGLSASGGVALVFGMKMAPARWCKSATVPNITRHLHQRIGRSPAQLSG